MHSILTRKYWAENRNENIKGTKFYVKFLRTRQSYITELSKVASQKSRSHPK